MFKEQCINWFRNILTGEYDDDILLYFGDLGDLDEFVNALTAVLTILKHHVFKCRGGKCEVGVQEVQCLGHVLSESGVRMSESRIAAVTTMPFPRSAKDFRRHLTVSIISNVCQFLPDLYHHGQMKL